MARKCIWPWMPQSRKPVQNGSKPKLIQCRNAECSDRHDCLRYVTPETAYGYNNDMRYPKDGLCRNRIPIDRVEAAVMTIDDVVAWIVAEAKSRLDVDHACPGGINAKIHGVSMEITLRLCEIMAGRCHIREEDRECL